MSEQENINRAYGIGLKLKNKGLSRFELVDAIKMQEVSQELAEQVANDILMEVKKTEKAEKSKIGFYGTLLFGGGALATVLSYIFSGGTVLVFTGGALLSGLVMMIVGYSQKD